MADLRLKLPFTLIVSGSSRCGKSELLKRLLLQEHCFDHPITEIVWVHTPNALDNKLVQDLQHLPVKFVENYPEEALRKKELFSSETGKLLILDDIYIQPNNNQSLFELFNIASNHQNISVVLTVQNLLASTPAQRGCVGSLLRSCGYVVLFVNRRMLPVVKSIASTYFPDQKRCVLEPFNQLMKSGAQHSYIVIDFCTSEERLQIREGGLVPGDQCYIYQDETHTNQTGGSERCEESSKRTEDSETAKD